MSARHPSPRELPDPQLAYDQAHDQLANQLAAVDSLAAKGGAFLAVGSTLVGIAVAVIALKPGEHAAAIVVLAIIVLAYLTMTYCTVRIFGERAWRQGPSAVEIATDLRSGTSEIECKWRATRTLLLDRAANQGPYETNLRRTRVTAWMLVAETLALVGLGATIAWC